MPHQCHTSTAEESPGVVTGLGVTCVTLPVFSYAAGICVFCACYITFQEIRSHIQRYDHPRIQVYVLRILLIDTNGLDFVNREEDYAWIKGLISAEYAIGVHTIGR